MTTDYLLSWRFARGFRDETDTEVDEVELKDYVLMSVMWGQKKKTIR